MENTHKSTTENAISPDGVAPITEGLALPTQNSRHGVTSLVAPGPTADLLVYKSPKFYNDPASTNLLDYLARPALLTANVFTTDDASVLYNRLFTPSYFTPSFPNITGVLGYRATVCFRLEVAAAPQAQGIVRMVYEYLPPNTTLSKSMNRPIISQLPGAEINLRSASAMEVKVPFVSDRDFWFLNNGTYTNNAPAFRFTVFPYAPVSWDTTTVSTPSWMLWYWFEDVELVSKSTATVAVTPQAGMGPEADHGKVSTWFRYAAKISSYAGSIPALSSIALPVSWAFDAATKIAAHFGFSKPTDGSYSGVMGMSLARGINTCADADFTQPMGYYANNEVAVLPGFAGNDLEEMSMCYLTCKPSLIASCQLRATDTRQQVKWTCPISPSCFVFQSSSTGFAQLSAMGLGSTATIGHKPGYFPSTIAYCASFFERWRGDLIFRFKFNTTKFHAGKVLIGYVPGEDVSDGVTAGGFSQAPPSGNRYDYESVIIDLRTTSEYDFQVPFTYPSSWCDTGMALNKSGVFGIPNTGSIFVRILEPLYGPDNVPQSVTMLVEVLGQCGLEFSQPITSIMAPLDPSVTNTVVAQSGMDGDYDATCYASGERILSLKQIAMRPWWFTAYLKTVIVQANLSFYNAVSFFHRAGTYDLPVVDTPWGGDSIVSRIGCLYALQRGGLVVRALPALEDNSDQTPTKGDWWSIFNWAVDGVNTIQQAALSVEWNMANMVRLPYYGKNSRMRTGWSIHNNYGGPTVDANSATRSLWVAHNGNTAAKTFICGVSIADDFQFGAFTGVPPCVTLEPNVAGVYSELYLTRL